MQETLTMFIFSMKQYKPHFSLKNINHKQICLESIQPFTVDYTTVIANKLPSIHEDGRNKYKLHVRRKKTCSIIHCSLLKLQPQEDLIFQCIVSSADCAEPLPMSEGIIFTQSWARQQSEEFPIVLVWGEVESSVVAWHVTSTPL